LKTPYYKIPFRPFSEKNSPEKDPKGKNIFPKRILVGYSSKDFREIGPCRIFCVGSEKSFSMKERFSEIEFCNYTILSIFRKKFSRKRSKRKKYFSKKNPCRIFFKGYSRDWTLSKKMLEKRESLDPLCNIFLSIFRKIFSEKFYF